MINFLLVVCHITYYAGMVGKIGRWSRSTLIRVSNPTEILSVQILFPLRDFGNGKQSLFCIKQTSYAGLCTEKTISVLYCVTKIFFHQDELNNPRLAWFR